MNSKPFADIKKKVKYVEQICVKQSLARSVKETYFSVK